MQLQGLKPVIPGKTVITIAGLLFSSAALGIGGGGAGSGDPMAEYASSGTVATTSGTEGGNCTVHRPREVAEGTPLILWGNGIGTTPSAYARGLRHWASWGFVVAAANSPTAGSGDEILDCIDAVGNADYGSNVDFSRIGASGHSLGGGGAVIAGQDPRVITTAPFQPYVVSFSFGARGPGAGPMLLMSGGSDMIAPRERVQGPVFERHYDPVFWATLEAAGHFEPSYDFGRFRGLSTAWWLYQLKGDETAGELFTGLCTVCDLEGWQVERKGF